MPIHRTAFMFLCVALALVSLLPVPIRAQVGGSVQVNAIDTSQFPLVTLRIKVRKAVGVYPQLDVGHALKENGADQVVEYFECPNDTGVRLSVAILLDISRSMALKIGSQSIYDSLKIRAAKVAIGAFIDKMGPKDQAALMTFTNEPNGQRRYRFTVEQDFTSNTSALKGALVPIVVIGGTPMWRATIDAINLLKVRPGKRVLILVTDGRDDDPFQNYRTPAIDLAISEKIPVFTIGLGTDLDQSALLSISGATGGRMFNAPQPGDLSGIFEALANDILTDDCILRYTSPNACLDGTRRDLLLRLFDSGFDVQDDTSFTVATRLSAMTLSVDAGQEIDAGADVRVPVYVREMLAAGQPLRYQFLAHYDPVVLHYLGIETATTISENGAISAVEMAPGQVLVQYGPSTPALPTGTLVNLLFRAPRRATESMAAISLSDAQVLQNCPTDLRLIAGGVLVHPCTEEVRVGADTLYVAPADGEMTVPVPVRPALGAGDSLDIAFEVQYDTHYLTFLGLGSGDSFAAHAVTSVFDSSGKLRVTLRGTATEVTEVLAHLRFHSVGTATIGSTDLRLSIESVATGCSTTSSAFSPRVLIDGTCHELVRRPALTSVRSAPNPFNQAMTVSYVTKSDGPVTLRFFDTMGRCVLTYDEGWRVAGTYSHTLSGTMFTAGQYILVLDAASGSATTKIVRE